MPWFWNQSKVSNFSFQPSLFFCYPLSWILRCYSLRRGPSAFLGICTEQLYPPLHPIRNMPYWSVLINRRFSVGFTQPSSVPLTAIPNPFTVKWAPLPLPELRCRFMPEQCRFLHIRWKPCLHIPVHPHPPTPFFSLSTLPLSLSSFFLRRHFNMYANGLRSTGKICAESCPAVRRCRRDCVCIYEAWALRLMGEKMLRVVWWRLCSAGKNADMPIPEVTLVTNDKGRQLDNNIPVN